MTVFHGDSGGIEIRRFTDGDSAISGVLMPEMVHLEVNRFAHPFDTVLGPRGNGELSPFITGDRVQIQCTDGAGNPVDTPLVLFADLPTSSVVEFYANVDPIGNIAAYPNFEDAINNNKSKRYSLVLPTSNQNVQVIPASGPTSCLANVVSYQFTTERETVDCTALGEEFRDKYTRGLISGQGEVECLWDYNFHKLCQKNTSNEATEISHYLLELAQRVTYGADFLGTFFLNKSCEPDLPSVWQEAHCIITGASFQVQTEDVIRSTVRFVTTGPFKFRIGTPAYELLQEDLNFLLQEDDSEILLEQSID
jgi:hypothetical protein